MAQEKPNKDWLSVKIKKNIEFINNLNFRSLNRYFALIGIAIVLLAVLLTVFLVQKQTNNTTSAIADTALLARQNTDKLKSLVDSASSAELSVIASERKQQMLKLAKDSPKDFLNNVLDDTTYNKLPQIVKSQVEKKQKLQGTGTKLAIDLKDKSETDYWLDDKTTKKRYHLSFTNNADITTGPEIKADAYTLDDKAVSADVEQVSSNTLGASTTPFTRKILAIRVLLSDNKTQGYDATTAMSYLVNDAASAKAFHLKSSFGIVSFTATVTPYVTVAYSQNDSCTNFAGPIQAAADAAATAAGYNPANYQNIIYMYPASNNSAISCPVGIGTIGGSSSTTGLQRVWYWNYSVGNKTNVEGIYSHELGHNLGMGHANTLTCGAKTIDTYSLCSNNEYGDKFDTIGYNYSYYPEDNGAHRYLLGYFAPSNVINVTASGTSTYTITNLETNTTSAQIIRIQKSTGDYYYLDYRRPLGTFDADLPTTETGGANLSIGTSNAVSGDIRKSYLLDMTPGDSNNTNSAFVDGKTFSDAASHLTIKQVSHTTTTVTLSITYTPPTPTPSPTITPSPTFTPTPTKAPTPTPKPTATPTLSPIPDNTPPTISITSPSNGSTFSKNSNVTISATAADNIAVTQVQFLVNGSVKCTDTTSPYSCNFKISGKPGSIFNITATAYDRAGNKSSYSVTISSN